MRAFLGLGLLSLSAFLACQSGDKNEDAQNAGESPTNAPSAVDPAIGSDAALGPETPDAGPAVPTSPPINGSVTIHPQQDGYVMLGDGSVFIAPATKGLAVKFVDPSIVGPQDVTFVAKPGDPNNLVYPANVDTWVQINRQELWVGTAFDSAPYRATFEGQMVASQSNPAIIDRRVAVLVDHVGSGSGEDRKYLPLSLSFNVGFRWTEYVSTVDLIAQEWTLNGPIRMGITRVSSVLPLLPLLPDGGAQPLPVMNANIVLDRPMDQPFLLQIQNGSLYSYVNAALTYQKGSAAFVAAVDGAAEPTTTLKGVAQTGVLAEYSPFVKVTASSNAVSVSERRAASPTGMSLRLPLAAERPALLAPANAPADSKPLPFISLEPGARFAWGNVDPNAQYVALQVDVTSASPIGASMTWRIHTTPARSEFTAFRLPAAVGANRYFPQGTATYELKQVAYSGGTSDDFVGASQTHARTRAAALGAREVIMRGRLTGP